MNISTGGLGITDRFTVLPIIAYVKHAFVNAFFKKLNKQLSVP